LGSEVRDWKKLVLGDTKLRRSDTPERGERRRQRRERERERERERKRGRERENRKRGR
jgi:hypothetical protein